MSVNEAHYALHLGRARISLTTATEDRPVGELGSMVAKRKTKSRFKETLGQRLARLRKQRGMTQVELAERIGLSQPNVSEYERDAFRPNSDTLLSIAQALDVSADELLGHRANNNKQPLLSRKMMRRLVMIEKLPRRDQQAILRTIDAFLSKSA